MNPYSSDFLDELAKQDELDDNGFLKFQQDDIEEPLSEEVSQNVEEDSATPIFPKQIKSVPIPAYNEEFLNALKVDEIDPLMSTGNPVEIKTPKIQQPPMSMATPKQLESIPESQASVLEQSPEIDKWTQILESLKQPRPELSDLEEKGNLSKSLITGLMGVNKGLETTMGSYGAKIADNSGVFKQAIDNIDKPIERYQKEQENLRKYLEFMQKQKPKEMSELEKARIELLRTQKDQLEKGGGLTPFQQAILDRQSISEKRRELSADRKYRQDQLNAARGVLKDDPRFKPAMSQLMEFDNVMGLIEEASSGNENAIAALGTKLARAMGEVGVLTDTDVVRYVQGKSWGRKLKTWWVGGAKGELPKEVLDDMIKEIGVLRKTLNRNINYIYENSFNRMKTAFPDLEESTINGLLGVNKQIDNMEEPSPALQRPKGFEKAEMVQSKKTGKEYWRNPDGTMVEVK